MKKIALLSWSDSNIAGDGWTWFITLVLRKNGIYSVGAFQTATDGPTYKIPSIYPLRTGRQVREAIEKLFLDDCLAGEEIDWVKIKDVLFQLEPELAQEVERSFAEEKLAEEAAERQHEEQEQGKAPVHEWIEKAKWPLSPMSHHIGNAMDNCKRRNTVFDFVEDYRSIHGRVPTGMHTLSPSFWVEFPDETITETLMADDQVGKNGNATKEDHQ